MKAHFFSILFLLLAGAMFLTLKDGDTGQRVAFWGALVCSQVWGAAAFIREAKR